MIPPPSTTVHATLAPSPVATALVDRAREMPDRVAVGDRRRVLTFAEFDAAVAAAAERIAAIPATGMAGDGSLPPVLPVLVDRSLASAIALHGAIRAGRPFTPVESSLPPARVAQLIQRLNGPGHAVVADPELRALLPDHVRPIDMEGLGSGVAFDPTEVDAEAPGCVVFTSGSTGRPKGVVRTWGVVSEKLVVESPGQSRVVPQVRPFSFSAGLSQLIRVATGDSLHIADVQRMPVDELLDWLARLEVTTLSIGASLTSVVLRHAGGERRLPAVTSVHVGGEPVTWDVVAPIRSLVSPQASIISKFAATEVGEVMRCTIGPDEPLGSGPLPIGVVERAPRVRLEPIDGPDSPMEMIIRDPLTMYYLDEPELTAQRFFTEPDGTRWWRSGDTVSVDDRGRYVHRGRVDEMVKINGMRIEPREAEVAVRALDGVTDAAVVVHTTPLGRKALVGHLVVDEALMTPKQAREHLKTRLAAHLVPAMLMRHDQLPTTERGKIDRELLRTTRPEPWRVHPPRKHFSEPALWIAGLVTRISDLGEVLVDDDVWAAGLDSLGAVELCAAIAASGLGELDPTALMEHTTPHQIDAYLQQSRVPNPSATVVLNQLGTRAPVFAIPGGGGTAFAFRSLAHDLGPDQPLVVIEPRGMHQLGPVDRSIDARARHALDCIDERLSPEQCCIILGYSAGAVVALEVCRRLLDAGRRAHLVLLDAVPRGAGSMVGLEDEALPDEAIDPGALLNRTPVFNDEEFFKNRWRLLTAGWDYYEEFRRILARATAEYDLQPVAVPTTVFQIAEHDLEERCRALVGELEMVRVGGDHHTMLQPPHVAAMADALTEVIARYV